MTAATARAPALKVLAVKKAPAAVRVKATVMAKVAMVRARMKAKVRAKAKAKARARARVEVASRAAAVVWAADPPAAAAVRIPYPRAFRMVATTTSLPVSCAKPQ